MLITKLHDACDAGARKRAARSERLCAATGALQCVDHMIRFVIGPEQTVVPDLKCRLPGRGVWVTATKQALELAVRRKSFAQSFRRNISVAGDIVQMTERLLERSALDALAMAYKGGRVAVGFSRVEMALTREQVVGLVHAVDAGPEGVRKLKAALCREDAADVAVVCLFSSAQLDLALGRSNVIHAALLGGPESETFLARAARLDCFRNAPLAGLPAVGRYRTPKSARAAGRREAMENHGGKLERHELDRDRNG
jgi:uncharacterized protein